MSGKRVGWTKGGLSKGLNRGSRYKDIDKKLFGDGLSGSPPKTYNGKKNGNKKGK